MDEVAVDLQVVEGEVFQVVEGAEARAEVVEREAAAELLDALGEPARRLEVGDRGRLAHLDDEAAGIDTGLRQRARQGGWQLLAGDRLARDVDLEPQRRIDL